MQLVAACAIATRASGLFLSFLCWQASAQTVPAMDGIAAALPPGHCFDMPLDQLPFWERNLLRIARTSTGQYLPAATLCYVWDPKLAVGTDLPNAYAKQVRYWVLDSASSPLQQWVSHARDIRADFLRSFGAQTTTVPPLLGIGIGADADNTGGASLAYVDALSLMEQ